MRVLCFSVCVVALVGCARGDNVSSTDAAQDRRNTPNPTVASEPPPPAEPPMAIGGGPRGDEGVYEQASALNVLSSAHCERAASCGDRSGCEAAAAAEHGDELARCGKGVLTGALSECARSVRDAPCGTDVAIPETCTTEVLCKPIR